MATADNPFTLPPGRYRGDRPEMGISGQAIVGIIVGGCVTIFASLTLLVIWCARRKHLQDNGIVKDDSQPFNLFKGNSAGDEEDFREEPIGRIKSQYSPLTLNLNNRTPLDIPQAHRGSESHHHELPSNRSHIDIRERPDSPTAGMGMQQSKRVTWQDQPYNMPSYQHQHHSLLESDPEKYSPAVVDFPEHSRGGNRMSEGGYGYQRPSAYQSARWTNASFGDDGMDKPTPGPIRSRWSPRFSPTSTSSPITAPPERPPRSHLRESQTSPATKGGIVWRRYSSVPEPGMDYNDRVAEEDEKLEYGREYSRVSLADSGFNAGPYEDYPRQASQDPIHIDQEIREEEHQPEYPSPQIFVTKAASEGSRTSIDFFRAAPAPENSIQAMMTLARPGSVIPEEPYEPAPAEFRDPFAPSNSNDHNQYAPSPPTPQVPLTNPMPTSHISTPQMSPTASPTASPTLSPKSPTRPRIATPLPPRPMPHLQPPISLRSRGSGSLLRNFPHPPRTSIE